jgi:hypothetical protein
VISAHRPTHYAQIRARDGQCAGSGVRAGADLFGGCVNQRWAVRYQQIGWDIGAKRSFAAATLDELANHGLGRCRGRTASRQR